MPRIEGRKPHVHRTAQNTPTPTLLEVALEHALHGWPVFPLTPGGKLPLFPSAHPKGAKGADGKPLKCRGECGKLGHGVHDATVDPDVIRQWWTEHPDANIGGSTDGRVVLDLDYQHGAQKLDLLPATRQHLSGRQNGNEHLVYRAGGEQGLALTQGKLAQGVDLKAGPAAYVVLPPSTHPDTGRPYTVGDDTAEHYLTDEEIDTIWEAYGARTPATARGAARGLSVVPGGLSPRPAGSGPTRLSELLQNPPKRGEGRTNDWLTAVAGHYAKQYRHAEDLYREHMRQACALVDEDYEEFEKVVESIWGTESASHFERDASADNGWLVGIGRTLFCSAKIPAREPGKTERGLMPYANFDILAGGVMVDEDGKRTYQVVLQTAYGDIDTTLHSGTIADRRKLTAWLMQYGATIAPHEPLMVHPVMDHGVRLQRYLESQGAPAVRVVDRLGWDEVSQQFVTFDGAIRDTGPVDIAEAGVIADRSKVTRKTAQYYYGFEHDLQRAKEVLREVLTFHYPEVVHINGAWWAATFLRTQAMRHTSLFPFMGVEAPSGSAKTNGHFDQMVQLSGNYQGHVVATKAAFRDSAATSNNGILWADDMDNPDTLHEALRASTSNGTVRKMSEERQAVDFTLSNPLLITGEDIQISDQKATLDRAVLLRPPSPTDRMSLKEGREKVPQWADIVELQRCFPGERRMTVLAGWYVVMALQVRTQFEDLVGRLVMEHRGRNADKYAILRAGARMLDYMVDPEGDWDAAESGEGEHAQYVDAWVRLDIAKNDGLEHDNRITQRVLPWALNTLGPVPVDSPHLVKYARSWEQLPPVLVGASSEDDLLPAEVWVNTRLLAQAWSEQRAGRIDTRLETEESLALQFSQIAYSAKTRRSVRVGGRVVQYRRLLDQYAELVLARARGDDLVR